MALEERSATLPGERVLPLTPGTAILHLRARGADALAWLRESSSTSTAAHVLAVLFFFTALYTLFFSPALFSSRILAPGDGISFYLNTFYGARSLWADELFAGFPIGADPQSMTWYPPAWLFSGLGASYNAFVISAYILGSSLMYGYVYSVTNSRFGALIGGITYGLCGFMMARVGHLTIIHVAAWGPLIIWSLEKLRERPQRAWMAVLAAAIALCALAGHSQMTLYILSLAAAYGVVRGWRAPAGAIRYYGISVVSLVLGIGMSAVCLLPAYQLSQESARSSLNFLDFSAFPLPWKQLPQLLFPFLFTELRGWAVYGTSYFGFIGFVPVLLGVVAIWLNRRSALTWFWVLAAVFGVLLSIGNATPLARILFEIPIYNGFRAPGRYLIVVSFSMSVLSGLGAASVLRVEGRARARAIVLASVTVIAAAAVILAGIVVFAETLRYWARTRIGVTEISIRPWENPAIGVPLIMLAASLSALWLWARWPRGWSGALLIAVLVLDLGSFGWFQEWRGTRSPLRTSV